MHAHTHTYVQTPASSLSQHRVAITTNTKSAVSFRSFVFVCIFLRVRRVFIVLFVEGVSLSTLNLSLYVTLLTLVNFECMSAIVFCF